ncbi:FecR family protein [Alteromonas sp. CYL-A6]|uniref:FecR family protein n=1 Tax=Alteromonas nitratireducens TaxID=3390813 RepID=UPI0034B3D161
MNNVHQFSTKEDIQEQAYLWISRLDRGLRDEEKTQLDLWLAESQAHRKTLMDAASLWDDMSVLNELSGLFPHSYKKADMSRVRQLVSQARWSVAAGFLLMAVAVGLMIDTMMVGKPDTLAHATQKITTGVGEQKNVVLADGSTLHLNTNTVLTVDYSNSMRSLVLLRGEAHFDVAHDKTRPFVVTAGDNTVTAVGTAFNMQYVDDNAFELVVTEGKVLVKDRFSPYAGASSLFSSEPVADEGLLMFAGEKAKVKGDLEDRENLSKTDIDDDLAWQQGMIVFKGEPLDAVLSEIGRYTKVRFSVEDGELRNTRVAGYFRVGDIEGLLAALKNSFSIEHQRVGENRIILTQMHQS